MAKNHDITSDLRDRAEEVRDSVRDLAGSARDAAGDTVEHLRDAAETGYRRGKEKLSTFEHSMEQYIRDQPVKSVLVAAGLGLLVGFIWRRI